MRDCHVHLPLEALISLVSLLCFPLNLESQICVLSLEFIGEFGHLVNLHLMVMLGFMVPALDPLVQSSLLHPCVHFGQNDRPVMSRHLELLGVLSPGVEAGFHATSLDGLGQMVRTVFVPLGSPSVEHSFFVKSESLAEHLPLKAVDYSFSASGLGVQGSEGVFPALDTSLKHP